MHALSLKNVNMKLAHTRAYAAQVWIKLHYSITYKHKIVRETKKLLEEM